MNDRTGDYAWDADPPTVTLSNGRGVDDIVWEASNWYYVGKKHGESGRYTDAMWSVNLRLSTGLNISNVRAELYFDVYNLFNWAAYRSFRSSDIRRPDRYATKTNPQAPRTAQVSLRISF